MLGGFPIGVSRSDFNATTAIREKVLVVSMVNSLGPSYLKAMKKTVLTKKISV